MDVPFSRMRLLERAGNFNAVVSAAVENYGALGLVRPELLKRIAHYLKRFRAFISPETINAIRSLPESDLQYAGLADMLEAGSKEIPDALIGRIMFPVVTSMGLVREISVTERSAGIMSATRLQILDQAGSAMFKILGEKLGRHCFWRPGRFSFSVLDPYGKDDQDVHGESMSLPLALALYSYVTNIPVPRDLSATASLGRDGSVGAVGKVQEKLTALGRERFFMKRLLVSDRQETAGHISGIKMVKVSSLSDAISVAFPGVPDATCFSGDMDLDEEIRSLNDQYDGYLIDTCIENADELIKILESNKSRFPIAKAVPALFTCYWKKGSCHCHRGEVRETDRSLKKALSLYSKYPGKIRADDYFDARVSYAVLLKDIFRYQEAEAIHLRLRKEMQESGSLDHVKGKNLSSLSQLYLAMGRFGEAEKYQRLAMGLINREEVCRNYGYMAQIHIRSGDFRKAAAALTRYRRLLEAPDANASNTPFFHWIRAEYLHKRGKIMRKDHRSVHRELHDIAEKYRESGWWVPALIHKFSGLALLEEGSETLGLVELDRVVRYFSSQFAYVLRLLGASVRAERARYFLRSGRHEQGSEDIRGTIEDLSMQKDIKRFFRPELSILSRFLRSGNHRETHIRNTLKALENIAVKIPY